MKMTTECHMIEHLVLRDMKNLSDNADGSYGPNQQGLENDSETTHPKLS